MHARRELERYFESKVEIPLMSAGLCLFFGMVACRKGFRFLIVSCKVGGSRALGFIDLCLV